MMLWLLISSWQLWMSSQNFLTCWQSLTITKVTHVWYRNNEPQSLVLPVASTIVLCIPSTILLLPHVGSLSVAFPLAFITFLAAFFASISLYRLSPFHPLAKYPGPTRCKLTKFWTAWISFGGRAHIYYKELHDKYGPIVRIGESLSGIPVWKYFQVALSSGPNELSIINVESITYILGRQGLPRGPSKVNPYLDTIFAYFVSFTSVGRKTVTNDAG